MDRDQFQYNLREFIHRQPFEPFEVELRDGRVIRIDTPYVAMRGDSAGFFSTESMLEEFHAGDVRGFRPALHGQGMSAEQFEYVLRQFKYRTPFEPFEVELLDGHVISVNSPKMVIAGGGASFLTEDELVDFECEQVRDIRPAAHEARS